jgi:deoxyadenosine/deoxycytidine kinase
LLEVFYKDRKRWSYTFQSCALLSRFQNIENSIKQRSSLLESTKSSAMEVDEREIFITERCLDTDFHVFTKMLRDEKSINKLEFEIYDRLYQHLKSTSTPLSAIIHVSTDPEECLKRIASRNRAGEKEITQEYLTNLEICQSAWITSCAVPVLRSDQTSVILSEVEDFVKMILTDEHS